MFMVQQAVNQTIYWIYGNTGVKYEIDTFDSKKDKSENFTNAKMTTKSIIIPECSHFSLIIESMYLGLTFQIEPNDGIENWENHIMYSPNKTDYTLNAQFFYNFINGGKSSSGRNFLFKDGYLFNVK